MFPGKNSPNIAKSDRAFPGKVRGDRTLILTYLNNPMAEVFPHYYLSFSISAIFRGKRVVKFGPKVQSLGPSLFHKSLNPSSFFQRMFLFARLTTSGENFGKIGNISGSKSPKTSQKGPFHGC